VETKTHSRKNKLLLRESVHDNLPLLTTTTLLRSYWLLRTASSIVLYDDVRLVSSCTMTFSSSRTSACSSSRVGVGLGWYVCGVVCAGASALLLSIGKRTGGTDECDHDSCAGRFAERSVVFGVLCALLFGLLAIYSRRLRSRSR
jgi:hypothetical protein